MPSIIERGGRWRALIRKAGQTRCATFGSRAAAKRWAADMERELEELRSTGVMQARGQTIADLIDRYVREIYPSKPWRKSKSESLAHLKKDFGSHVASKLTSFTITEYFRKRRAAGAAPPTISCQISYLVVVLRVARSLWKLDVPVQAAQEAREALTLTGMAGKSRRRERRVSDAELHALCARFEMEHMKSAVPFPDILQFLMASAMRLGEVCSLRWADLDRDARTIIVHNRKHPTEKEGNDSIVPLLNATGFDAFAIIIRQPRIDECIFPAASHHVSDYFIQIRKKVGIENIHLHDIRHEAISRFFAAGYQIQQVALLSGHKDWKSLRRYTHIRAADLHPKKPKQQEHQVEPQERAQ